MDKYGKALHFTSVAYFLCNSGSCINSEPRYLQTSVLSWPCF